MSNPYQQFSCGGSNSKTKAYTPRLTPDMVIDAVPKLGSITFKQLSRKVGFREPTLRKVLNLIEFEETGPDGVVYYGRGEKEIEQFSFFAREQHFRRVKKDA